MAWRSRTLPDQRDRFQRFRKAILLVEQTLTDEAPCVGDESQTTQNIVAIDGSDTYEDPKNEERRCYWMAHSLCLLNPRSHQFFFRSASSAPRTRDRFTCLNAEASLTNAELWPACKSTALLTEWCSHPLTEEPAQVCEVRNVPLDNTVMTEQLTPKLSIKNATNPRAVHTRGRPLPSPRRARILSPDDNNISQKPRDFCTVCSSRGYSDTGKQRQLLGTTYQAPLCSSTLTTCVTTDHEFRKDSY